VNLPSEFLPLSKVVSCVFSLCTSTDEAEAEGSDLEEVPAVLESESGAWQRRTRRNRFGVCRGSSEAGVAESLKQRALSSGGRDIEKVG
jgi:hypothetical protein